VGRITVRQATTTFLGYSLRVGAAHQKVSGLRFVQPSRARLAGTLALQANQLMEDPGRDPVAQLHEFGSA
jgi:hypothetical protein